MDTKVFVAIVDSVVIGRQVVPNVARVVKVARDRARKASQAKAKMMMAKEKAKVASGKHAKHLMGAAITVGNGDTWKRIVSPNPRARVVKAKVQAVLDKSEENGPENTSVGGFGLCSFRNHCDDWKWNNCRKVTFTLDSGAAVSAAPKSLGDDHPMQIEEPRSYKTATGSLVQDKGFRVLPIVTEEGVASLHELQSCTCSQSIGVSVEGIPQRLPNHPDERRNPDVEMTGSGLPSGHLVAKAHEKPREQKQRLRGVVEKLLSLVQENLCKRRQKMPKQDEV